MVNLVLASTAITLLSGASANLIPRNQEPSQPSCTSFTPFKYAGCYADLSAPRALLFSGPSNNNMTVETCVAFCKGNEYKYAGLEYYNECFCGDTVNGPQVDESFCTYPCAGDSSETCGGTDYINIYQDTTFPTVNDSIITDYKPMGCYSEGTSGRSLAWRQDQLSTTNLTVESCLFACKDGGYPFAGVEFGEECYCGVVLGNGTTSIDSSSCSMPCTGNANEICGGPSTLDLYFASDLESSQPCNGGSSSSSVVSTPATSSSTSIIVPPTTTPSSSAASAPPTTSSPPASSSSPAKSPTSSKPCTTSPSKAPTSSSASSVKLTSTPAPIVSSTMTPPSLCTSTIVSTPTPTCEYKCGNWCSKPLPVFTDKNSCAEAVAACGVQVAACFLNAGFPASLNCFEFSSWCTSVQNYCGSSCPGNNCSPSGCKSKYPPAGYTAPIPTTSTSVYICPAKSTSSVKPSSTAAATTTSSCVPVPTQSNICTQAHNPSRGYSSQSPVGNIALPCLTCNNLKSDFSAGNCFKLYTNSETTNCPSYSRNRAEGACRDACDSQYNSCVSTYAEGCRGSTRGDTYSSASNKCYYQWQDCYAQNQYVSTSSNRCSSFNQGWY